MDLNETRKSIDRIDAEIMKLLNNRMEFALKTKNLKKGVEDPAREQEVLSRAAPGLLGKEFSRKLFEEIIGESKRLQAQELRLVGFQGEHGAYSEIAVKALDDKAVPLPCPEFADVFEGVESGQLDLGVVPVENSLEGSVNAVNDLLVSEAALHVVGEINVPIHHCLLALPETDYRDIKVVYSHPQALGQCRGFLSRNKLEARPYYDTAGAAAMLSNERPKAAAVIASKLCAEIYGLEVLKENVEDHESNSTRFLVLSRQGVEGGNKCSVVFSTKHKAGALFSVLKIFADAKINLTRIESRPVRGEPKKFAFLLDLQGSEKDANVAAALEKAGSECESFNFLGCYNEAVA